jgi:hypothetical protein
MLRLGAVATAMFDEAMVAAARCRQAIGDRACAVRRDAWTELHGVA